MAYKKYNSRSDMQRLYLEFINVQKQLIELSKSVQNMGYASIADVLVAQVNISNQVPTFWRQLLLQNTSFMSLVTKLALAMVKQQMDAIVKNPYFKLPANNITLSTLEEFSLEKIESNFKLNAPFFHSLIREVSGIFKVNTANGAKNTSNTTPLAAKSREDCHFQHSRRESQGKNVHSQNIQSKNDTANRYSSDNDSNKDSDSSDSNSNPDAVLKGHRDRR